MSAWETIGNALQAAGRLTFGGVMDALAASRARRAEAAFSIALIALSAKMARADGVVTDDEIDAFHSFLEAPPEEAANVRMLYRLAQKDVAGYDHYLKRIARQFEDNPAVLEDVLDCLHHVALADGVAHPNEIAMLDEAAAIFGLSPAAARRIRAAHLGVEEDPYAILGVAPEISPEDLKTAYRRLMREHHPDALAARGVPASMVRISEGRTAAINAAYEKILAERKSDPVRI